MGCGGDSSFTPATPNSPPLPPVGEGGGGGRGEGQGQGEEEGGRGVGTGATFIINKYPNMFQGQDTNNYRLSSTPPPPHTHIHN